MRITRVVFSFFAVGFVAGTFEQAAGLGDAQHGQRASITVAAGPQASGGEPAAVPAALVPSVGGLLAPPAIVSEGMLARAPAKPAVLDMGDARAAEAVVVAFGQPAAHDPTAVLPEIAGPSPKLRPFLAPPEEEALVAPVPKMAERPREFIMPIGHGRVTSMFHQGRYHPAIDLAAPLGTPVRATTRKQKVTFAGQRGGYGNLVITRDPSGRQHYYGHLQRIVAGIGTLLEQGDLLGLLGSTGHSTGPHVHYEVRKSTGGHFNPATLLFPGFSVERGFAWNDGGSPAVATARPIIKAAARPDVERSVRAARPAKRRTAGRASRRARYAAREPVVRHYRTRRAARYGTRYAARSGQPRPR